MRVVLAAAGTRGDVAPMASLAARLVDAGHSPVVVTHASLAGVVPAPIEVVPVDSDPASLLAGPAGEAARRRNPLALDRARQIFADFVESFATPARQALRGADLLVASTFALAAVDEARTVGVPVVRAHQGPDGPDPDGPMAMVPYAWRLPGGLRRPALRAVRGLEPCLGGFDGWWERGRLHVVPHLRVGLTTATLGTLQAYSPLLDLSAVSPDPTVLATGWWRAPDGGRLSAAAERVLASGDRWIYVGFGSMPQRSPESVVDATAAACWNLGLRALVQLPEAPSDTGGDVVRIDAEPHAALFPRLSAVVHHGGSGTTGASTAAGVPAVVVPHFADQFYWAHRLHALGVAAAPLPHRAWSTRRLTARLAQALDPSMRARAGHLGSAVRAEDGTGAAVAHLERLMAGRDAPHRRPA